MDTAKLLLEKTSSEEEKQKIIKYSDPSTLNNALHFCAQRNHVEFALFLLDIIGEDNEILIVCYSRESFSSCFQPLLFYSIQSQNKSQRNPLMEAANTSALRISKAILKKAKKDPKVLDEMLTMKCDQKLLAINHAIASSHRNSTRCAKIIISYYGDDSDAEQIFLPCLQLGDMKLAQKLWNRTTGDDPLQERMMKAEVC